jgi:hypothetical protein
MPYFITDSSPQCANWATVKEDGEVMGCHGDRQGAIDQMVALSLTEDIKPGGERALPENYRPALAEDVPEGLACGNCRFYDESIVEDEQAWCQRWQEFVRGDYYCNAWDAEQRAVRAVSVPEYISRAAERGLELNREGFGGDGLADSTLREARQMAAGNVSDSKIVRANAWAARHAVNLEAPQNTDPEHPDWPGAGAVAHYLWGIDPTDPAPARRFFEREAARIQERTTMQDIEIRSLDTEPLELRAATSDNSIGTFAGYAIRYDSPSLPLPFTERVARGALTRTLKAKNDVRMYVNHDDRLVLASTRAKTLRLEDRDEGLYVEADLPDTTYANDLRVSLSRGDTRTMSFGFSTVRDSWSNDGNERTLEEIRLHEVSVVTGVAAYPATTASVRSWLVPAKRAAVDPERLTVAIAKLNGAEMLTDDDVRTISAVIESLRDAPETVEETVEDDTVADVPVTDLSTLRARLSLLERRLGLI